MKQIKNQLIISSFFILINLISAQSFSQHNIFIDAGGVFAQKNMYLSNGLNFDLGYQYNFAENFIWRSSINAFKLNKNPDYSYTDEENFNQEVLPLLPYNSDEISFNNLNINTNAGIIIFKEYRIQAIIFAGISANFTNHRYSKLVLNKENDIIVSVSGSIINADKFNIGFPATAGILIKITEKIKLQIFANYNTLPFVKIGIQEKQLNTLAWQGGILFKL